MTQKQENVKIKRMNAEKRKKQLLDCATRLFGKMGYHQTQISDILHAANVSRGTFYQYFKNKDDIFATILENLYADWRKVLFFNPTADSEEYKGGRMFFIHQIKITLKFFMDHPDYCTILLNIGLGVNTNFDTILRRLDKQMVEFIYSYLSSGIKLERIKPEINMELTSNIIGGSVMRMLFYYGVPRNNVQEYDLDVLTEWFVDYISYGIFINDKKPAAEY